MADKIDTVTARNKLKIQREPYWHRISKGCYVGYRKMSDSSTGTWRARFRDDNGNQLFHRLGTLDEHPPHQRFDAAVDAARGWLVHVGTGVTPQIITVLEACKDYVKLIEEQKGNKAGKDLDARYLRWVEPDPIGNIALIKLTREHMSAFRGRLVAAPVRVNKAGDMRARSKDSVNRDMASVRAALNHAFANGKVSTDLAWREALKAFKNAGKRRDLYLDRAQRRTLIEHAPDDLAAFLRGLSVLPLRPGALAGLTKDEFDRGLSVLTVGKDKAGRDRKIKLPPEIASLLEAGANDWTPTAPLLTRADGRAWNKDSWKWPIKDAVKSAGLPAKTTAYTLRHSVITDLVHGGLDLLTVAQISGTSVAMIEKHYGHLRSDVAAAALAKLVL